MFDSVIPSSQELIRFLPETILTLAGTLVMVLTPFTPPRRSKLLGHFAILAFLAALAATAVAYATPGEAFSRMLVADGFATFFRVILLVVGILTVLSSYEYLEREGAEKGEFFALLLFSIVGQSVMATANELIMIFIGIEISSIASYVLAGYFRDDRRGTEAAVKYFLLGSFATAFILYGVAWIYGLTGSTNLSTIRAAVLAAHGGPAHLLVAVAAGLMLVGLAFKVSAAPFQIWAPDVYQGAPSPVSGFLSAGPKAAAFAVFLRVFMTAFEPISGRWEPMVWMAALLSMVVGNLAALTQSNLKRMLAYSSIAHAGYVLVALSARSQVGTAAAMFYLASYALMNVGAFAVVTHFSRKGEQFQNIEDFAGLGRRQPFTAAMFTIFLFSLIGVPLTGGFFGKFYIFKAALESGLVWLSILGLLNSAVAAYYYLRILVVMYMHGPGDTTESLAPLHPGVAAALVLSAASVLYLGIFPGTVLNFASRAAALVR